MMYITKLIIIISTINEIEGDASKTPRSGDECFTIGSLHNFQHVSPLGYFELPTIKGCKNIDNHTQNLTTFKGKILRYNPTVTSTRIWKCSLYYIRTECNSANAATTTKRIESYPGLQDCRAMLFGMKTVGYYKEYMHRITSNYYKSKPRPPPGCNLWRKAWTHYEAHFELRGYPARLIGSSTTLQQQITRDQLIFDNTTSDPLHYTKPDYLHITNVFLAHVDIIQEDYFIQQQQLTQGEKASPIPSSVAAVSNEETQTGRAEQ